MQHHSSQRFINFPRIQQHTVNYTKIRHQKHPRPSTQRRHRPWLRRCRSNYDTRTTQTTRPRRTRARHRLPRHFKHEHYYRNETPKTMSQTNRRQTNRNKRIPTPTNLRHRPTSEHLRQRQVCRKKSRSIRQSSRSCTRQHTLLNGIHTHRLTPLSL